MLKKIVKYLPICLLFTLFAGKVFAATYDFTDRGSSYYWDTLHPLCQAALGSDPSTVTIPIGNDNYAKVYAFDSSMNYEIYACFAWGYIESVTPNIHLGYGPSDTYNLIPIYETNYSRLMVGNLLGSEHIVQSPLPGSNFNSSLPTYNGVPVFNGTYFNFDTNYPCQSDKAEGYQPVFQMMLYWDSHSKKWGVSQVNYYDDIYLDICLYTGCFSSDALEGNPSFSDDACCLPYCNANYYGDGCTCTPCPCMTNKAGVSVCGNTSITDNATLSKCLMGTSHVFSDETGDWSFETACPAS